jgi:hypothetical protein
MLRSIAADLAAVPGCRVVTTLDIRCPALGLAGVDVRPARSPGEESELFAQLASQSDVTLVIAPELGDALTTRCRQAREARAPRLLNPETSTVALCSDKLQLYEALVRAGLPTIPTAPLDGSPVEARFAGPCVVKPQFGAGSQDIFVLCDAADVEAHWQSSSGTGPPPGGMIVQPYVPGTPVSIAILGRGPEQPPDVLPIARQHLSSEGRLRYLGGSVPWQGAAAAAVRRLAAAVWQWRNGWDGYVGLDVLLPDAAPEQPLLVEINPRLTTSYLGYRTLACENLAARMLAGSDELPPPRWRDVVVTFTPEDVSATVRAQVC